MAKNKSLIILKDKNLCFEQNSEVIKLINLNPNSMILEVEIFNQSTFIKSDKLPFAHLPRKLKAKLNPK